MKVLFLTSERMGDYLTSCVWDGLQEVLGEENVYDGVGQGVLHAATAHETVYRGEQDDKSRFGNGVHESLSGRRQGQRLHSEYDFDVLILCALFFWEYDMNVLNTFLPRLRPGAKVAYIEGWDSPHYSYHPPIPVHALFRKEIDPGFSYPYESKYLSYAAPSRWFHADDLDAARPFDVFFSGNIESNPHRWPAVRAIFETGRFNQSIVLTQCSPNWKRLLPTVDYFNCYRKSKLALCPASADIGGADPLRPYEAAACGCIPILVGYPPWRRDNWFNDEMSFRCESAQSVAATIDKALSMDLRPMRERLLLHARKFHTTRARAETILTSLQ